MGLETYCNVGRGVVEFGHRIENSLVGGCQQEEKAACAEVSSAFKVEL